MQASADAPSIVAMVDSVSKKYTKAPPLRVWDVLCDGHRYADWVMGTKEIRAVDDGFPAVGTAIHFTAGVGPITYKNKTTVRSSTEMQCLELEAHGWPAGSVRIVLTIEPSGEGCNLTFDEHPLRGPARWLHNPVTNVVFNVRTSMILDNLIKLAESGEPTNVEPAASETADSGGPGSDSATNPDTDADVGAVPSPGSDGGSDGVTTQSSEETAADATAQPSGAVSGDEHE